MAERPEGGTAPLRLEWVEETAVGEAPTDPAWALFSDNVTNWFNGTPDANVTAQRGGGDADPVGFFSGTETHEFAFQYDFQQWFIDGGGNTQDPSNDAIQLASDNSINATHTVVSREVHAEGGTASGGRRLYTVGKGGTPGSVTIPFETEEGTPVNLTLNYQFEKVRWYEVSQPSASTTLTVSSSDASDTTQTLTIEDEDAGTTEDVSLNGTTDVTTTSPFADIDAAELDTETAGDVTIEDGSGNVLLTINGTSHYITDEGDLGIPALGSGSHASAIGSSYVIFNDDALDYDGTAIAPEIISGEASIDLGIDSNSQDQTARQDIYANDRTSTVTATVAGAKESVDKTIAHLQVTQNDIKWTADEGSLTFPNAVVMDPGNPGKESSQGKLQLDVQWESEGVIVA